MGKNFVKKILHSKIKNENENEKNKASLPGKLAAAGAVELAAAGGERPGGLAAAPRRGAQGLSTLPCHTRNSSLGACRGPRRLRGSALPRRRPCPRAAPPARPPLLRPGCRRWMQPQKREEIEEDERGGKESRGRARRVNRYGLEIQP